MSTQTKMTVVAAILLSSVSGAFASESFDVNIYRPAVSQGQQAYAQAPRAQIKRHKTPQPGATISAQEKAFFDRASQVH